MMTVSRVSRKTIRKTGTENTSGILEVSAQAWEGTGWVDGWMDGRMEGWMDGLGRVSRNERASLPGDEDEERRWHDTAGGRQDHTQMGRDNYLIDLIRTIAGVYCGM